MNPPLPRGLSFWAGLIDAFEPAAAAASRRVHAALKPRSPTRPTGSYRTRKPGYDTPLWNICRVQVSAELTAYGSKVRLARYLGIPKQRLQDFLNGRSRLPDAELTLRMLHWLAAKRAGRDLSL